MLKLSATLYEPQAYQPCFQGLSSLPPLSLGGSEERPWKRGCKLISLTNRFHVAVRLFSNRLQMTSKCGQNKKVAHEAMAECVTDVLTTF